MFFKFLMRLLLPFMPHPSIESFHSNGTRYIYIHIYVYILYYIILYYIYYIILLGLHISYKLFQKSQGAPHSIEECLNLIVVVIFSIGMHPAPFYPSITYSLIHSESNCPLQTTLQFRVRQSVTTQVAIIDVWCKLSDVSPPTQVVRVRKIKLN